MELEKSVCFVQGMYIVWKVLEQAQRYQRNQIKNEFPGKNVVFCQFGGIQHQESVLKVAGAKLNSNVKEVEDIRGVIQHCPNGG